ncbi:single-stranded DNA-binding protein [Paenisporosarcina sp. OV554]|uniref:single-stranded DNA-binding protein n=1 Tax=Paenisporosarcina sp. OV554 TaxID=2135694 RepID=UPI000D34BDDA|nr:single-stranded DNA-binding protein [Paenisporosarcina sp. OV554]PUB10987.1 single-strand binding protein [Paenisporosarcina sp. OV554]
MINRVVLVGRLTKDPELRYTPSGVAVARFTIAVNRSFSNQQGEKEADFINCTVWRKPAENTANFLKKGSLAGVEGRIQTGSYEGTDGKRVYTTEVVADSVQFLEPRNSSGGDRPQQGQPFGGGSNQNNQYSSNQQNQSPNQQNYTRVDEDPFSSGSGPIEVSDDDLPF